MTRSPADDPGWHTDQRVRIRRGSFRDFVGAIATVDPQRRQVGVRLSLFNRPVTVELKYEDIECVSGGRGSIN